MAITRILATKDEILFTLSPQCAGTLAIRETVPVPGGRTLSEIRAAISGNEARIPRFDGLRDRLTSRFETDQDGAVYASEVLHSENTAPYPQPERIKALGGRLEDIRALGLMQTLMNINLTNIMVVNPAEETIDFSLDGETYHFRAARIHEIDEALIRNTENGLLTTLILLNSPKLFGSTQEKALLDVVLHPKYEWDAKDAFLSGFNMEQEAGQNYFRAFVEFLAQRYSRADRRYGQALGMIISNEVDSQCVWSNSGEMTVQEFTHEYSVACRLAYLSARKYFANYRIYISLDQFFSGLRYRPLEPLHTYPGREVIDCMNDWCVREGNFGWNVAFHPYPEDLRYPDFWNDRAPDFSWSTPKITFKNMEVLPDYLSRPELLYQNAPRRIIFSEQGFNSQQGALQSWTERQAAAAYCLAYLKARALPTVDLFTHHSYLDNPHEFGLNLGIRRYDPAQPDHVGERKPIFESIRDMDTAREPARIQLSRAFIGEDLFDYLLNPPLLHGDLDDSLATDFG